MYTLTTGSFGKFATLTLKNEMNGEYVSIIPERGATVHELFLLEGGRLKKILDTYATAEEFEANHGHKSSILMPYPNRVKNGIYTFKNMEYHLPIDKPEEGNAIHGFVCSAKFEQMHSDLKEDTGSIMLGYVYKGGSTGYPFAFSAEVTYQLGEHGFSMSIKTTNTGPQALPIAVGWHPYFLFEDVGSIQLQLPLVERLLVEKLIPTGEAEAYTDFASPTQIGETAFDTCFKLISPSEEAMTRLLNVKTGFATEVWQQPGKNKYNFVQLYTPLLRNSIAIEPMTAPANAFNSHESLIVLEPQEAFRVTCGIRLRSI